jgi:hypothetical protein
MGLLGGPNVSVRMELNHGSISLCASKPAKSVANEPDCTSKEATADIFAKRRHPEAFCAAQERLPGYLLACSFYRRDASASVARN